MRIRISIHISVHVRVHTYVRMPLSAGMRIHMSIHTGFEISTHTRIHITICQMLLFGKCMGAMDPLLAGSHGPALSREPWTRS